MPAPAPYIPTSDSGLSDFADNFAALTTATPGAYGLSAGDAATIASQVAAWHVAYDPLLSPSTKTAAAVAAKVTARVTLVAQLRGWAQPIAINPGVSSGDKVALGLNPRTTPPSPITPPATNPVLTLQSCANLSAIVRYRDSAASPSVKSKPFGVTRCEIQMLVAATPPVSLDAAPSPLNPTKSPFLLTFDPADAGKQCYIRARWVIRTGGVSPWSPTINFTVVSAG